MKKPFKAISSSKFCLFLIAISLLTGCQQAKQYKIYVKQHAKTWILKTFCLEKNAYKKEAPAWMYEQIKEDLAPFSASDVTTAKIDQLWNEQMSSPTWPLLRVKIVNNKILLTSNCSSTIRISYIKEGLDALVKRVVLPDADFLIVLGDSLDGVAPTVPIFTFANNPKLSSRLVLMPDFEAFSGSSQRFLESVRKGNKHISWAKKIDKSVWRGSMTGGAFTCLNFLEFPRSKAVFLSLQHPDLIDAKYVGVTQCSDPKEVLEQFGLYFGDSMSIEQQLQYKYQLLLDGNSCSYSRAYWQLFSNSLIFKQASDAVQWYSRALIPFVHYVPIAEDVSDLVEMMNWAKTHDKEARAISLRAQKFANENLTYDKILQYFYLLLSEYSKLQKSA